MKHWLLALLLVGVVVGTSAQASAETISVRSPFATTAILCSGGSVYLTGFVHYTQRGSESEFEFNYQLTGTDQATGNRYRFEAIVIGDFSGSPTGDILVETFIRTVRLVELGTGIVYKAGALVHVTMVNGVIRASIERIEASC
jgi:hypothetical protein